MRAPLPSTAPGMLLDRPRLFKIIEAHARVLIAAGQGLGKTTLLEQAHYYISRWGRTTLLLTSPQPQRELAAFLRRFTNALQAHDRRLFQPTASAYHALTLIPEDPGFPLEAAQAIARDLHDLTIQNPYTVLIDDLDPSPSLTAFISSLMEATPHIHYVLAGPETLSTHFSIAPLEDKGKVQDLSICLLTSNDLAFKDYEARHLGLSPEAFERSQGIPLLVQALLSKDLTTLFLREDLQAYVHHLDPVLMRAAFIEDWTVPPPPALLQALDLPTTYLNDYQRLNWPFTTDPQRRVPLLTELLRHALYTQGDVDRILPSLATYYDSVDPIRAHALRNRQRTPFALSPEALASRQAQLHTWTVNAEWQRIRDMLSTHLWEDAKGLQIDLDAADTLLLITALRETAQHLEDLRFALQLLHIAEGQFLWSVTEFDFVKADLLYKLGRLTQAQETYLELFERLPPDHPRKTELRVQLALCYLQAGKPLLAQIALGPHPTENPDPSFQVALLQTQLMRGNPSIKTKQQAAAVYDSQEDWSQLAPELQCRLIAALLDVGLLKPAYKLLRHLPADECLSPWLVTERHRLLSVYALRQQQLPTAEQQAQLATSSADHLSQFAHLPGPEYQDLLTRWQAHQWQLLVAIASQDHSTSEQQLAQLQMIARLEGNLSRQLQRCRIIFNASQHATLQAQVADAELIGNDHTELTYVLRCCLGSPPPRGQQYPRTFDTTWSTWAAQLGTSSATQQPEPSSRVPVHTLHLNMLNGTFTGQLGKQSFDLSVREAELLYVLATTGPQSSEVLGKQLFHFSKNPRAYVNVTASNLGRRRLSYPHTSESLVALDPKTNTYQLHPAVQLTCDVHTLDQLPLTTLADLYKPFPLLAKSKRPQLLTPEFIRRHVVAHLATMPEAETDLDILQHLITLDPPLRAMLKAYPRD
ncbi:hypothetical protein [Deinococcus petrolearius]|uniref:Orc1-like AAA ATPase domain-containing protein n=1 Tax=Deinococcus petrolearius TaxID=1751295 RepID=A0ABW1DKM5_9DEIO